MNDYSEYTVRVSGEPSYYGPDTTQHHVDEIVVRLREMIQREFPGCNVEPHIDGQGESKTTGPDMDTINEINDWIADNWTAAL